MRQLSLTLTVAALLACSEQIVVTESQPGPPKTLGTPKPSARDAVFGGYAHGADTTPRPISGGTLITMAQPGAVALAVASDADEDAIDVVALQPSAHFLGQALLQPGDEPGRLVADAGGRVHVILRGAGVVATLNPYGPSLLQRRAVCSAPRGIDYDAAHDTLWVVCATGEVMTLGAAGGDATLLARIDRDLRDIVIDGGNIFVSRFREAEVLVLDASGNVLNRTKPSTADGNASADVAWRMVRSPGGGVMMLHQLASTGIVDVDAAPPPADPSDPTPPAPYGSTGPDGTGGAIVEVAVTSVTLNTHAPLLNAPLVTSAPVRLGINPVVVFTSTPDGSFEAVGLTGAVVIGGQFGPSDVLDVSGIDPVSHASDELVAIADARQSAGVVVVQRRSTVPAILVVPADGHGVSLGGPPPANETPGTITITLPQRVSHIDTGLDVFHLPTGAGIACMNCHPEGGDDGHTWLFRVQTQARIRRTQSLRGGVIASSAPYHWDGEMLGIQSICDEIFSRRMGGGMVLPEQAALLTKFLEGIPRIPVSQGLDPSAVERGRVIFQGTAGCVSCHAGPLGTSVYNQDVGKIDALKRHTPMQIPMLLGVADRAPYMHDGCAATLMDRLTKPSCAGTNHGNTAGLSDGQLSDLEQYLESL